MKVAIFYGSKSDDQVMAKAIDLLKEFGVSYESYVLSAHRVPEKLVNTIKQVEKKDVK